MKKIINPHDKLFRETYQNKEVAADFLYNYLPADVLNLVDLDSLEISKDSFVEEDMAEYFSDLLYKVNFKGEHGYVYVLFEHKSYKDNIVHLQLLEYMIKIWRLYQKQMKSGGLSVIIPLVLYHGQTKWKKDPRFSKLFSGPVEKLSDYIPDFNLVFYNLAKYSDEEIKGKILTRVVLLLFKHIFDIDIKDKLPGILSLLNDLLKEDTGLKYLEVFLRYLFSTIDNITVNDIKNIVEQSLTDIDGDQIMTLAEELRNEGFQRGMQQGMQQGMKQGMYKGIQKGELLGLLEGIELAVMLKFGAGENSKKLIDAINKVEDLHLIKKLKNAMITAENISDLMNILQR